MNRRILITLLAGGAMALMSLPAAAQEVTLRLHQFLPPVSTIPKDILKPWAEGVEQASGGRIKIQHFDAMALGGKPPDLMDQARDGIADITMTLPGYTPGRFPRTEVFELPFMMTDPEATAKSFWTMIEEDYQASEYGSVKVLAAWVHGPGVIHTADGVATLEDMKGKTVRGPTRIINNLLSELGATPVGMPVPAIPEALSKGVINGTVIPWEVTPALKIPELVTNHTEFGGDAALYTATFVLVMNKARYDALPDDLKAVLDAESGLKLSAFAARTMAGADAPGRKVAASAGNAIVTLDQAEADRWKAASTPVVETWKTEMAGKGVDGAALIERAKALIAENSQ